MVRTTVLAILIAGCHPAPAPAPVAQEQDPEPVQQAAPDAGVSAAVAAAPPWVFRYRAADRDETWTLRVSGTEAMIEVVTPAGLTRYLGSATEGETLVLELAAPTARIALDCKHAERAIGAACNDSAAAPVELLDCYHKDFDAPMPFGPAPGIEYVVDATCNGYRLVAP